VETLKVVRNARYDPVLEDRLGYANPLSRRSTGLSGLFYGEDDDKKEFRNQYVWAIGMLRKLGSERLAKELEADRTPVTEMPRTSAAGRGWSYAMATSMNAFATIEMDNPVETQSELANNEDTISIGEKWTEWSVNSLPVTLPFHVPPHSLSELRSFRNPARRDIFDKVDLFPDSGEMDSKGSIVSLSLPPLRGKNTSGRGRNALSVQSSRRYWDSESQE